MGATDSERIATAIGNAQRGLATGVTTMRDTGGYFTLNMDVRDAINAGHVIGPRLLVCGAPITTTAGHLHWCGLRADNRDEVVEAVRTMAEAGADFIKVMATGGMMTPGTSPGMTQYSESELQALVDDSHRLRKQVAAHVLGTTGCILAIDAGVDTLEHCSWLDETGEHGAFRFDAEAAARIQPGTQSVHMTVGAGSREHVRGVDHLDEMSEADREELYERGRYHRAMRASGTPVVVSSDAGVMTTKHDEFALTVIAAAVVLDLSPVEAINITTYAPASTIGLGDVTGALKPGLAADVLVVEDDVAENICCVADPIAVYLNGREVARAPAAPRRLRARPLRSVRSPLPSRERVRACPVLDTGVRVRPGITEPQPFSHAVLNSDEPPTRHSEPPLSCHSEPQARNLSSGEDALRP